MVCMCVRKAKKRRGVSGKWCRFAPAWLGAGVTCVYFDTITFMTIPSWQMTIPLYSTEVHWERMERKSAQGC